MRQTSQSARHPEQEKSCFNIQYKQCTVSHPSAPEDPGLQCPLHAGLVNQRAHPDHGVAQHLVLLLEVDHLDPDLVKVRRPDQADEALLYHGVAGVVAWPGLLHRLVQAEPNLEVLIR